MSPGVNKKTALRHADDVFANLDLPGVVQKYLLDDATITARQAVRRYYPQLLQMKQQGLTYEQLCQFLAESFDFSITPRTLRDYMNAAKELEAAKRSPQANPKQRKRSARSQPQPQPQPKAVLPTATQPTAKTSKHFTPAELDAALELPDPGNPAAMACFFEALNYIDDVDPARWRRVSKAAHDAGINISGTLTLPADRINQLFNQY